VRAFAAGAALLGALAISPPALAAYRPQLLVSGSQLEFSQGEDDDATARVAVVVPRDYRVAAGQPSGAVLGNAAARVTVRGFDVGAISVTGRVVAGSTGPYAGAAAACGATSLEGVWLIELSAQGQALTFPLFVERVGTAVRLLVCFPSPAVPEAQGGAPFGVKLVSAVLSLPGVVAAPQRKGLFTWSGLFTPYLPGSATLGTTVEARAIVPVPGRLTLRAKLVGRKRTAALLAGQLTEAAAHPNGVRVRLYSVTRGGSSLKIAPVATARTRNGGRFVFRRRITRTLSYFATVPARRTSCVGSAAPGGCVSSLVASQTSKLAKVSARRR
jgi:hypothetical protein